MERQCCTVRLPIFGGELIKIRIIGVGELIGVYLTVYGCDGRGKALHGVVRHFCLVVCVCVCLAERNKP